MHHIPLLIAAAAIILLNFVVYGIFKAKILKVQNPAMKFLLVNGVKDFLWCAAVIFLIEKLPENFFILTVVFLLSSFFLYYFVIKAVNKL